MIFRTHFCASIVHQLNESLPLPKVLHFNPFLETSYLAGLDKSRSFVSFHVVDSLSFAIPSGFSAQEAM